MNSLGRLSKELFMLVGGLLVIGIGITLIVEEPAEEEQASSSSTLHAMSVEREVQLGAYLEEVHLAGQEKIKHSTLEAEMGRITSRLLSVLDTVQYDYRFQLIRNDDPNAFTLPGGSIVVHSGLIAFCEQPEELAAVIAHELGHAEQRHVVDRLMAELGLSVVLSVVSGGDPGVIQQLSAWLLSNVFSRSQEREADAFAHALLIKAGIAPHHLGSFFQRMDEDEGGYDLSWLSTHPSHDERIQSSTTVSVTRDFEERALDVDWEGMQRIINDI